MSNGDASRTSIKKIEATKLRSHLRRRPRSARFLLGDQVQVVRKNLTLVIGALLVEQFGIGLPVQISNVERTIGETDKPGFVRSPAREQRASHGVGIKSGCRFHHARIMSRDFLVIQTRVEILNDTCPQSIQINVNQKTVATCLHTGKDIGNSSGSDGQSNQFLLTAVSTNGRPRGTSGLTLL